MIQDILLNFNWIDAVIIACILRSAFVGATRGLIVEFFKFLGMVFATIITLHFYSQLGTFVTLPRFFSPKLTECLAFLLIWLVVVLIFKFIREGWSLIHKSEEISGVSKILGGILAIFRGMLIGGMIFVLIFVSQNKMLMKSSRQSFISLYLLELSPRFYNKAFDSVICKFFPDEKINNKVFALFEKKTSKK
jgi:uncharacterized membrane protein required for colicin V production